MDGRTPLKIGFADWFAGFSAEDNYFTSVLRDHYDVELVKQDPDLLICSSFGFGSVRHPGRKLLFTGESFRADLDAFDAAVTFDHLDHPRHFRMPLAMMGGEITRPDDWNAEEELSRKTRFCNFVVSNPSCARRNHLFFQLSKYKQVDSGGRCFNNMGGRVKDKSAFQRECKFTIAYENTAYPGYVTEKINHAFRAISIPIYWGDPLVGGDFNPRSFLNADDFENEQALIERIIELDRDDEQYLKMLRESCYHGGRRPEAFSRASALQFFTRVIESDDPPVATRHGYWRAAGRHAARVKADIWKRRLRRWRYRAAHAIFRRAA